MSEELPNRIVVEIDSELQSIVPDFLDMRRKDGDLILEMLEANEFKGIYTIGHRMKGAGGSYGFDVISELGEKIENACQNGEGAVIRKAVAELRDYLERVSVVYV